jgi:hypothetical protein
MAGRNATGKFRTSDAWLTGGTVQISPLSSADGFPGEWRDIGCLQSLSVNSESDVAELFCSDNGVRTKVSEGITEVSADLEMTTSDISYDNIALALLGETSSYDNNIVTGAATGLVAVPDTLFDAARAIGGRHYNLYAAGIVAAMGPVSQTAAAEATRLYGLVNTADVTLVVNAATYNHDGINMEVDTDMGTVFVISGSALEADLAVVNGVGGGTTEYDILPNGIALNTAQVQIDTSAAVVVRESSTLDQFVILTATSKNYALRVRQVNSDGKISEVIFHSANLRPNGELGMISPEDFSELTLAGSLNKHSTLGFATGRVIGS